MFLVGFMASGKTTVGGQLARRLGWDFVDLDAEIESRAGQSIAEIFRSGGEREFRLLEASALRNLTTGLDHDTVVALGGGTLGHAANVELLRPWPSIFLDADPDVLWKRSQQADGKRPLRKDYSDFARLHNERLPSYRDATVTIVTAGKDPASLCAEIEGILKDWDKTGFGASGENSFAG